jgi:hypothetical protein
LRLDDCRNPLSDEGMIVDTQYSDAR